MTHQSFYQPGGMVFEEVKRREAAQAARFATRDAIVLLRTRVDPTHERPTDGDCWLLNAVLHLEGRMPACRISEQPFDIPTFEPYQEDR